jgi:hypothetical protein
VSTIFGTPKLMLMHASITIVVLLLGYGILCLRSKLNRIGNNTGTAEPPAAPEAPKADPIPISAFPFEEIHEVLIPGSELRYCHPFGPADTIADIWCKLQTLSSTNPIMVRLGTPDSAPLFKSPFSPDGVVHSTGAMFADEFTRSILRCGWPSICRQVRALSSFGVPADASEGKYHIYTGLLLVELKGVHLSRVPFLVRATFGPNFRLILRHLSTGSDYLHCAVPSGGTDGSIVVGFPWTLTRLTLYSDDRRLTSGVPEFVKTLKTSYEKYALSDPSFTGDVISDGIVAISVSEGIAKGFNNKSLQITYAPVPYGPLDDHSMADQEFVEFAKALAERRAGVISSQGDGGAPAEGVGVVANR